MAVADVVVVGGGPAGASAAVTLARGGLEVVVVDRAVFPRDKTCGDGLTTLALRELEVLGLDPSTVPSFTPVDRFAIRGPAGRWVHVSLPPGPGWYGAVARRAELDATVLDLARAGGARVLEGRKVVGASQGPDRVTLEVEGRETGDEQIQARYLVGADGMWSPTRKALGAGDPHYRGDWYAFRQYAHNVSGQRAGELVVWFDADLLPGYAWSFPLGDGVTNVGLGIWTAPDTPIKPRSAAAMKNRWPELLDRPHIRRVLGEDVTFEDPPRAWPIPTRVDRVVVATGRALWVGDAAAACDPMTGEGIGSALLTGRWAAEAILAAGPTDADVATDAYLRRVTRDLLPDHRMALWLARALQHRKGTRIPLWLIDRNEWTRRNYARWLWEDYPRALITTPRRWHRRAFTGPGAFASTTASGQG